MSAPPAPPPPGDPPLPQWFIDLEKSPATSNDVPIGFMLVWGGISSIALGGGAVMGFRAFEDTVAFEALDKMDKPTPAAERSAARMAMRAFGWGTALAVGTAAAAVGAARYLGVRSASDVGMVAKSKLQPFDDFLKSNGDSLLAFGASVGNAMDGLFNSAAAAWHESWLGSAMRGRVERTIEHHEGTSKQAPPE